MPLGLILLFGVQTVEPPRTVNDGVLGTAEEVRTAGPARVCLIFTSVDVRPDENAYLAYLGIHWGGIRVIGPRGEFVVREGDAWREPPGGRAEREASGRTIVRHRHGGALSYLIYARTEGSANEEKPVVWVDGSALGRSRDRSILRRIRYHPQGPEGCTVRYDYGWDWLFGPSANESEDQR